jgi:hypothetical protein
MENSEKNGVFGASKRRGNPEETTDWFAILAENE